MTLEARARADGLTILGGLHPDDGGTLYLLGPDEPRFWQTFIASPEYSDSKPDPMDRWSERVIGSLGRDSGGTPVFPFGGPPYHPFIQWALDSGGFHMAPVPLLIHETRGVFSSFRGAIHYPDRRVLSSTGPNPCDICVEKPCLSACPVGALGNSGYDVPACHAYLDRDAGQACLENGCAVRRACPVGQDRRQSGQSAFHMRAFHGG